MAALTARFLNIIGQACSWNDSSIQPNYHLYPFGQSYCYFWVDTFIFVKLLDPMQNIVYFPVMDPTWARGHSPGSSEASR